VVLGAIADALGRAIVGSPLDSGSKTGVVLSSSLEVLDRTCPRTILTALEPCSSGEATISFSTSGGDRMC
jgi:hypothetical protein